MCRASASLAKAHSGSGTTASSNKDNNMSSSSSSKKKGPRPAFDGANFDKTGHCLKHATVQLAEQVEQDGRVLWKEVKMVSYMGFD